MTRGHILVHIGVLTEEDSLREWTFGGLFCSKIALRDASDNHQKINLVDRDFHRILDVSVHLLSIIDLRGYDTGWEENACWQKGRYESLPSTMCSFRSKEHHEHAKYSNPGSRYRTWFNFANSMFISTKIFGEYTWCFCFLDCAVTLHSKLTVPRSDRNGVPHWRFGEIDWSSINKWYRPSGRTVKFRRTTKMHWKRALILNLFYTFKWLSPSPVSSSTKIDTWESPNFVHCGWTNSKPPCRTARGVCAYRQNSTVQNHAVELSHSAERLITLNYSTVCFGMWTAQHAMVETIWKRANKKKKFLRVGHAQNTCCVWIEKRSNWIVGERLKEFFSSIDPFKKRFFLSKMKHKGKINGSMYYA